MDQVDYYERYAGAYYENTVDADMGEILDRFLVLLPENAEVLDLGCGSGRDSIYMEDAGCYVTLLDGSAEMCKLAEIHTDKEVLHMKFEEMDFHEVFDGIWACASLLHVEERNMDMVMKKVIEALLPGGILYMSFRDGEGEEIRGGRFMHDYSEKTAKEMVERQEEVQLLEIWTTEDVRGNEQKWVNVLLKKEMEEEVYEQDEEH